MKTLLVAEYRDEKVLDCTYELVAFANKLGGDSAMFLVGHISSLPKYEGTLYLADAKKHGEYNPAAHKALLLDVIAREQPDYVVFSHSSYGWDMAPRISYALGATHLSEVVDMKDGALILPTCNAKLRRVVSCKTRQTVITLQAGAFNKCDEAIGVPDVQTIDTDAHQKIEFEGYEKSESGGIDLTCAHVVVGAGRGIGKRENLELIRDLAKALKGDYGASRPVVDADWTDYNRQIGTTGQVVSPKVYFACGISGAIQHVAGIKKSGFVVAINTDKTAPIGEVADVLVVADLKEFVPKLTERIGGL